MGKILGFLQGKKTYIVAVLMFVNAGGMAIGWWNLEQANIVNAFLMPLGLGFLRNGVNSPK